MNPNTRSVIEAAFTASHEGRLHFGEVVERLLGVQVESYHVDYRAGRATYYLADDSTLDLGFERPGEAIARDFDDNAMRAAIAGAQQGRVMYPEFKLLSQRAGCVGYTVWIAGRRVTYSGRRGESHVECFPQR